ncbi:chalcone isomerase family protein [Thalassotalea ganghwensis]
MVRLLQVTILIGYLLSAVNAQPLQINGASYTPVGKATFSVLWFDIYQSELFTRSGRFSDGEVDFVFKIDYLKAISRDELLERTIEQWQHIKYQEHQYQSYLPTLKSIWPDIDAGDQLMMVTSQDKSEFFYNGQPIGEINDANFGRIFIDIWVSPNTSQPKLRKRLLGEI